MHKQNERAPSRKTINFLAHTKYKGLSKPLHMRACGKRAKGTLDGISVQLRVIILFVFDFCDDSMREKDWRCRKRGMQAT